MGEPTMYNESGPSEAVEIGGGRRLATAPDALSVEVKGRGTWIRSRVVPYEDIRAVYRFEKVDTNALVTLAALWLALLVALLIWSAVAKWNGSTTGIAALAVSLLLGGLAIFRTRTAPARLLRIEAYSGVMVVPDRSAAFFKSVAARIRVPDTSPAGTTPGYPAYGETPSVPPTSTTENSDPA